MGTDTLVNPTVFPLPDVDTTKAVGIFPSDLVLRTALIAGLTDIRKQPWLLDFCFSHMAQDFLTRARYGRKEIARAKEWFLGQEVEVSVDVRPPDGVPTASHVTVAVLSSDEAENTIGDVDPFIGEDVAAVTSNVSSRFDPVSYDAETGRMVLPEAIAEEVEVSTYLSVADARGVAHPIEEVESSDTIRVAAGTVAPFQGCFLRTSGAPYRVALEGATFRETYLIGCFAHGEPIHLTYLHSIVLFVLLRYRQELLEARGLERTQVSSKEVSVNGLSEVEGYHLRYITLNGIVRHVWPKVSSRILSATTSATPVGLVVPDTEDLDVDMLSRRDENA